MTNEKDIQDVTDQHTAVRKKVEPQPTSGRQDSPGFLLVKTSANRCIPLREEVERELRVRAWKDEAFRQELIANPKGVIERLFPQCFPGGKVPDKVTYKVIVEDPYTHHIILPALRDELTSQMSQERQEEIIAHMGCGDMTWSVWPCTRLAGTCGCTRGCTRGCR
jgi:hypothetical protein